jgi:hypothetical protein
MAKRAKTDAELVKSQRYFKTGPQSEGARRRVGEACKRTWQRRKLIKRLAVEAPGLLDRIEAGELGLSEAGALIEQQAN